MKPLLALPLIGTGGAGGVLRTRMITEMFVDLLPQLADEYAVDIVLCAANLNEFMLMQVYVCSTLQIRLLSCCQCILGDFVTPVIVVAVWSLFVWCRNTGRRRNLRGLR